MQYTDLLGKPFQYGGRGPIAYDCYGLAIELQRRRGVALPDFGSAVQRHVIHRMIMDGRSSFRQIPLPEPWCLVTFSLGRDLTSHIGVVLDDGKRFIHIMQDVHVCVERLASDTWKNKVTGYYHLIEPHG